MRWRGMTEERRREVGKDRGGGERVGREGGR